MIHIVIVVIDGGDHRSLHCVSHPLGYDQKADVLADAAEDDDQRQCDGDGQWKPFPFGPAGFLAAWSFPIHLRFPCSIRPKCNGKAPKAAEQANVGFIGDCNGHLLVELNTPGTAP